MNTIHTFYLSRILGNKVVSEHRTAVGRLEDLAVDVSFVRPKVIAARVKFGNQSLLLDFSHVSISKQAAKYVIHCSLIEEFIMPPENVLFLVKHVLDKQIVDIDGRKLERVNDLRLAFLSNGLYIVAVDVGLEGLLRRLAVARPLNKTLRPLGKALPTKLILWDDVAAIGPSMEGIKLSKEHSKLETLHPSDLADILEDLDHKTQVALFSSLDEEKAADVLEEMETEAQINVLEGLSVEKAADVLEKMPADEVADILDDLEKEKAEELLSEMEDEAREEVRELMDYPENTVGSLMSTDFFTFNENMTVKQTIEELRKIKPPSDTIYYLYVLDDLGRLVATVSLRDLIIAGEETPLSHIMNRKVIRVMDHEKIDSLAGIISKYNLIAIPVVDEQQFMVGIVIIDDVVFTLLKARKRMILKED
ncbi:MAG TPA: CBS domain-containing protein [Bacteroidales bacterium]|nr:CBS domain-containing protein [Bacteroidales bacterium]HSA44752.1 CBS domain-containing protein [Bacteroidales bacterium]